MRCDARPGLEFSRRGGVDTTTLPNLSGEHTRRMIQPQRVIRPAWPGNTAEWPLPNLESHQPSMHIQPSESRVQRWCQDRSFCCQGRVLTGKTTLRNRFVKAVRGSPGKGELLAHWRGIWTQSAAGCSGGRTSRPPDQRCLGL